MEILDVTLLPLTLVATVAITAAVGYGRGYVRQRIEDDPYDDLRQLWVWNRLTLSLVSACVVAWSLLLMKAFEWHWDAHMRESSSFLTGSGDTLVNFYASVSACALGWLLYCIGQRRGAAEAKEKARRTIAPLPSRFVKSDDY